MVITLKNVLDLAKSGLVYCDTPLYTKEGKYRRICSTVTFVLSNGQILSIDRGFEWDESSIPWYLRLMFPKSGKYATSALLHDALYYLTVHDKDFVENEFKIWMEATEIGKLQTFCRYWGVKIFGKCAWKRNTEHPSIRCINNRKHIRLT